MDDKLCPHCERPLEKEREIFIKCCMLCRRFGLLCGVWPDRMNQKGRDMTINLTNIQVARVLELCAKIAAVTQEMPMPPEMNSEVALELAKNLRASIEKHNDELIELGALLRDQSIFSFPSLITLTSRQP